MAYNEPTSMVSNVFGLGLKIGRERLIQSYATSHRPESNLNFDCCATNPSNAASKG